MIRSSVRTFLSAAAFAWSKVPERERRALRPLLWGAPGLQRLRRLSQDMLWSPRPEDPTGRQARQWISDALYGERTRGGVLWGLLRLAIREPGTLVGAASVDAAKTLIRRVLTPDAVVGNHDHAQPTDLEFEVRAVLTRLGQSSDPANADSLERIALPQFEDPDISFVIPVWNHWRYTYACLAAIARNVRGTTYEVVVVDNGSSDETPRLLSRVGNLRVVRNETNLGFLRASNQGAAVARGRHLLFLNNDTHLLSGTVGALLSTIDSDPTIGAVGGRMIFLNGRLQEAGSIVWSDGSCLGYGRNDDPFDPQYSYVRVVDYCSAAMLLTRRDLFLRAGGFDERYAPAYYEDSDYCMTLRALGHRVVYQPAAVVIHREFGSSPRAEAALEAQARNRSLFVQKWASTLGDQPAPSPRAVLRARDAGRRRRLLFVDDRVPDPRLGTGYPRANSMVTSLQELGWSITLFPLLYPERLDPTTRDLEQRGVEVITRGDGRRLDLKGFLEQRRDLYDVVLISRPHNMKEALPIVRRFAPSAHVVYDAEAIFAERELRLLRLQGGAFNDRFAQARIRLEGGLVGQADAITAVSAHEAKILGQFGARRTYVVGHSVDLRPTAPGYDERADLLFVGGILDSPSPNEDALLYFVREILPLVRRQLRCSLSVVGTNQSERVAALNSEDVRVVGRVDDLEPWYSRARVFVVPTRYAAGLPMKLHEAASVGLPSVVTPLIASQVGWSDGREVIVGSGAAEFASGLVALYSNRELWERIRAGALKAVQRDCTRQAFLAGLRAATEMHLERANAVTDEPAVALYRASGLD